MRIFTRGDIDGFFGLALDNLVQLLVIDALCRGVLGFPVELVYGRILPGAAVSLLVGNLYYARQALALARATGRTDVCALPYGINTVSLFAYVFQVRANEGTTAIIDGQLSIPAHAGTVVSVRRGPDPFRLVRHPARTSWQGLVYKLKWCTRPA